MTECANCKHWRWREDLGAVSVGTCPATTKEKYRAHDFYRSTFSDESCDRWEQGGEVHRERD